MAEQESHSNKKLENSETEVAPQPPAAESSSLSGTLLIVVLLAAGAGAYYLGYLDKPLADLGLTPSKVDEQQASPPAPAETQAQPAAVPLVARSDVDSLATHIEALQSRINKLEISNRDLLAITENHADQIVRQGSGEGGSSAADLVPLQLEIIDLRLRVTGDTIVAEQMLGELAAGIDESSQMGQQIKTNRQRLLGLPPRNLLLERIDELTSLVDESRVDVLQRIAVSQSTADRELEGNWLAELFNVQHSDARLEGELRLVEELGSAVAKAKPALLLSDDSGYTKTLAEVQVASDRLRDHAKGLNTTNIAQVLAELTATGFPDTHLVLTLPPAGTS